MTIMDEIRKLIKEACYRTQCINCPWSIIETDDESDNILCGYEEITGEESPFEWEIGGEQ